MKLKDIDCLGIADETRDELFVDPTRAIVADEFNRKMPKLANGEKPGKDRDYRHRAIQRLIAGHLPIHSECNIAFDLTRTFVSVACPYCHPNGITKDETLPLMTSRQGSGSSERWATHYECKECGAKAYLAIDENGLSFVPKGEGV